MFRSPLALFLVVLGSLASASAQSWVEYKSQGAGYRVEFPQAPKVVSEDVKTSSGVRRMEVATFEARREGASLTFMTTLPERQAVVAGGDPQAPFDKVRDDTVSWVNGKLREEKQISIGGQPARRSVIDMPQDQQVCVLLQVMRGDQLYKAIAVVSAGQENGTDTQRFINSFALLPR
ncbi:hypothetical protein SAMN02990966_04502 [Rhodospirillales bacterium URHD0017]|nr:hypothetical protein SAMN02990966_04502 [Rhodospirillales bacterium URHD0017]